MPHCAAKAAAVEALVDKGAGMQGQRSARLRVALGYSTAIVQGMGEEVRPVAMHCGALIKDLQETPARSRSSLSREVAVHPERGALCSIIHS
mmetsp:Transcript_67265/g.186351  ORF Transcript_67265/g.186351 Transcript_67265/m.186351 type:complete len:92 (-) Transcript_67265:143-418(-)